MQQATVQFSIADVVDILHLKPSGRDMGSQRMYWCPFCGKKQMYVDFQKNVYRCVRCETGGGLLDLYSRVALGRPASGDRQASIDAYNALLSDSGDMDYECRCERSEEFKDIYPAADDHLDRAYNAVLDFFTLTDSHKKALLARGLREEDIKRNSYRSVVIPEKETYPDAAYRYENAGIEIKRVGSPILSRYSEKTIIAGMAVADHLLEQGISPAGVPGFFKICDNWILRLDEGLLIPTRNCRGEIVAMQTRKDSGSLRYMTLSSKGLPEGVTTHISRSHFPLQNYAPSERAKVMITEGPLKADVAASLMRQQNKYGIYFVAQHGVSNRNDLPDVFTMLYACGCRTIYNAYDMDKLLNPGVKKASLALKRLAKENLLSLETIFWDKKTAEKKLSDLQVLLTANSLPKAEGSDVFITLSNAADSLRTHYIQYDDSWEKTTKGIDDFLLHR